MGFRKRWTFWLLLLFLTIASVVEGQDYPAPPPLDTAISWDVHRSLGLVLVFKTDRGKLYFAHPVLMTSLVPSCKGISRNMTGQLFEIIDIRIAGTPMKYTVLKDPTVFRYEGEDWQPVVYQSFKDVRKKGEH